MRKIYVLVFTILFACTLTNAQVSNYTFSQATSALVPITGGTVIVTATETVVTNDSASMDDFTYAEYPLPFPFYFGTGMQTTFRVNSNGWLGFGPGTNTSTSSPISSTNTFNGIIAPYAADLLGLATSTGTVTSGSSTITAVANTSLVVVGQLISGTGIPAGTIITGFTANTIDISNPATSTAAATLLSWTTGDIRFETLGVAPNRTFVVQFLGLSHYNTSATGAGLNSIINFQIRLAEGGGNPANQTVTVVYGPSQHPGTAQTGQVGLRGSVNTDFNNRTTTTDWTATTAGATNTATVTWGPTSVPPPGLTFIWTPPALCVAPPDQPTNLVLTPTANAINGSFTPAASAPGGYLVVQTTSATPPTAPANGTIYPVGSTTLGGTVISSGPATTFSSTPLNPSTTYYYWVYSFNNTACSAGPIYNAVSPLTQSAATLACTITGTKTVGPTGDYATLTAAIADITANGLAAPVILELQPTYTSGGETFPITIGVLPCAVNGLTIRPQAGATGLIITSANTTATIDLNGATNVTIDGRPGGVGTVSQLTITNTATGAANDIRFINDASNNTVTYTTLQGSSTTSGVVFFSTGVVSGNDNNTISNNTITAAGASFPVNGILSTGSSTAIDNSSNTVIGNNIADVFSASAVYTGINIGSNNNTWSIQNNRIYQTASRAITTANTNRAIAVTTGAGHTISGNVIGFANAAGTGVTATTSTVASRYIGILGTFTSGGAVSNIQNNTIAGFTMTTSSTTSTSNGVWAGINVTAGNANIDGNTIGATTGTGSVVITPSSTGGLLVGINAAGSSGTVTINNNSIGALTNSGTTATVSGAITGIQSSSSPDLLTISNNTIGNNTADNIRTGTSGLTTATSSTRGINIDTSPDVVNITNNTIQNLVAFSTGTSSLVRGIETTTSSTAPFTITGNTVNNLRTNSGNTSISSGLASAVGIHLGDGVNSLVSQNVIHSISNFNTTTTGTYVAGITHAGGTNTVISRNRVYNITNAGTSTTVTSPSIAAGIIVRSGTTAITIVNNMISLGTGQTTNTSFLGIQLNHGSTPNPIDNVWFNTIHIEGTAASGAQPTFGIARTDFSATARTATVDIRNNIINNVRTGGTGSHYAIANNYGAAASSATGWGMNASNYNVLNANAATIGWWTGPQTFAGWRTASNSDWNSFSNIPVTFVNPATGDLHLNMGTTPTQLESSAQPIAGITTDYDNQVRPGPAGSVNGGALGPDMGADEFDGVLLDLTGPLISYTPFTNTLCPTGTRVITATITDISGVNGTAGTRPRLYYKKTTNANVLPATNDNTTDGWKYVEATNSSSPFSFTLDYNRIFGGVAQGDVIQYFIVAQDMAATPNVGINSGTFTGTPTSVALAPGNFPITGTINSFSIPLGGLTGTVTVGAAGTYPTLTGAGGLFEAINNSGLTGNVVADILDATITEPGTNPLNQITPGCGGPFTLLIKPASGVTSTLTGALASGALIKIFSDNVTIDGSNNGTTTRDLTITNTSTTSPSVLLFGSTGTRPIMNSTLKNSTIINGANSATAVIISDGTASGTAGYFNNITIQNNSIQRAYMGIYSIAQPMTGNGSGLLITGNDMTTVGANSIRLNAIYAQGIDGATITNNTIGGMASTDASNVGGIWLATSTMNSTVSGNTINGISTTSGAPRGIVVSSNLALANVTISGNTVTGLTSSSTGTTTGIYIFSGTGGVNVQNNQVSNIKNTSTTGFGANGIQLASTLTSANINVRNNFIWDVAGDGFNGTDITDNGYGIIVVSGGGYNIDHNTVHMNTDQPDAVGISAAINIQDGVTAAGALNIRNNIFVNTQTLGTRYAIISEAPNTVFNVIDYNDYFSSGANLGLIQGVTAADLTSMQTLFGGNTNSVVFNPTFVSATDLHLSNAPGANWCLEGRGTPLASVPTDIDGQVRSTGTPPNGPDMGADEFTAVSDAVATPSNQPVCSGATITPIVLSGSATSFNWTRDNTVSVTGIAATGSGNITGALTNTTNAPVTVTFTITPVYPGGCTGPAITATVVVNPTPNAVANPASQTACSGAPITTIALTGNVAGTVYNWTRDNTGSVTGIPGSGSGDISGTLVNTTTTPVTVTFTITPTANGCSGTPVTATVLVNPMPTAVATPASQPICSGSAITPIVLSGGVSGTTFNWTRDNTVSVTGIPASGSGNISGSLTNTTTSAVTVTFTITPSANGCPGTPITATVTVNPKPVVTGTITEPSTCVSNDGAISLTITGASGPFSYVWTGPNVIPGNQNQTALGVGIYSVTVTDVPGGCSTTANFTLVGPGGCAVCPTIGSVATNPSVATCQNQSTTITASGLTDMGITYGIQFKYSPTSLADPYTGGTNIATVPNSGLTGGGTTATTSTSFATPGTYFVYAILSPVPTDPACRPSAVVNLIVNPTPDAVATPASQTSCSGAAITTIALSGSVSGTTYNWTRDNTATVTGIAASGSGNISGTLTNTTSAPVTVTFTITPTANGCTGTPVTATVVVNPMPNVNTVANQTLCNGSSTTAVNFTGAVAGTVFNWTNNTTSIGLGASGSGNIASFVATNTGTAPVTATITVTPSYTNGGVTCTGTATTFTITVNPIPTVNAVSNQTVCHNASTSAVNFTGAVTGTVYNWTNSNTTIGLGASGSGNIPAFVATNSGNVPVTSTVTVTPSYTNGGSTCTGTPVTFTITVNPNPTVNAVANQTVCTGANTAPVNFSGAVAGTVYNWTNSNPAIGLAASGTGNIASFVATNTGSTSISGTVTVTPSYTNGGVTCTGTPVSFTITVSPVPTVNAIPNQTVCAGTSTTPVTISGAVPGTVFNWTNTNTAIGLGASGTGNIAAFTATNTGTTPITSNITVIPVNGNCVGNPVTFTITVNPAPNVNAISNVTTCAGSTVAAISFAGTVPNTVFNWTNSNTTIGLPASGTGNIASFTAVNNGPTAVTSTVTVTPVFTSGGITCTGIARTFTITVNPRPVVTATALNNRICLSDTLVQLTGSPVGGSWSGIGVSGFNFVPTATAVGTYTLTYTYVAATGCAGTATITAKVEDCPERLRLLTQGALTVYPNPSTGQFNVRINSTLYNFIGMKVFDAQGKLVNGKIVNDVLTSPTFTGLVYGRVIPVDLSHLPSGVYILKFYHDSGNQTAEIGVKVVIAR